jgi:hypothetical protein
MPLISDSIPNLINGISQQPPSLRLKTQAEVQENGLSSVVDGLRKRPPTEHIAKLANITTADDAFIHTIRRDEDELYIVVITKTQILVYDKDGVQRNVTGDATYLAGLTNPAQQLTATSIADYTYIVNKNVTVQKRADKSPKRNPEALVYVRQGDYSTDYKVTLNWGTGSTTVTKTTLDAAVASNQSDVKTNKIASDLKNALVSNAPSSIFNIELFQNTIFIERKDGAGDFTLTVEDSRGNTFLKGFKEQCADFLDLPPTGKLGFKIKIAGSSKDQEDDYFVSLQDPQGSGTYVWREDLADDQHLGLDKATMPHQLVKQTDGTFVFQQGQWDDRTVGDDFTNPFPTFAGNKINDVFFHRNRLGFLSDENAIFSEAGEYGNFFLKTVLTALDSNPIDVAVSNNQVSILKHAIPFNESLLLFSDLTQFVLKSGDLLTPENVSIDVTTQFEASLRAKPVGAGRFVFFAFKRGAWSGVREYYVEQATDSNTNALDITAHVPQFLRGEIKKLAASSNEETLLAISADDPNAMYVYRYYWSSSEKLQASWSRWTFDGQLLNADFNQSDIFVLIQRPDGVYLERINLSRDITRAMTTTQFPVHLDRRVILQGAGATLPYTENAIVYVSVNGKLLSASAVTAELAAGRKVFAGIPYRFRYRFSEIVMKKENEPITIGRLQIRNLAVVYFDTGYFEAHVSPKNRATSVVTFTGRVLGSINNTLGSVPLETGTFRVPVLAKNDQVVIELISDSFLPCAFQSAEWEGYYVLRSGRQ